jgi:hypothetical protein
MSATVARFTPALVTQLLTHAGLLKWFRDTREAETGVGIVKRL